MSFVLFAFILTFVVGTLVMLAVDDKERRKVAGYMFGMLFFLSLIGLIISGPAGPLG